MAQYFNERRRFPRYSIQDESALLVQPSMVVSDNLINVGMGGAAFSYNKAVPLLPGQYIRIRMVKDITSCDVHAVVVSDTGIEGSKRFDRRCRVEFAELSREQKEKLSVLISRLQDKQ